MTQCTYCGFHTEYLTGTALELCPQCGRTLPETSAAPNREWVDVARVTNLAEAGFLSDELIGLDIDARVHQTEDFSELHGGRKTHYLIRVPAECAQEAAAQIRSHVVEAAAEREADDRFGEIGEAGQFDPAYWRPVALVVLAGMASFVLGRQTAVPPVDPPPAPDSLAAAVGAVGRSFLTETTPGSPRHRLTFDRPRRVWRLDVDINGDGVFDTQRQFSANGAAR
jgi:hypothetical protein